jgi:hypothetical protein
MLLKKSAHAERPALVQSKQALYAVFIDPLYRAVILLGGALLHRTGCRL